MSIADQGSPAPSLRRLPFTVRISPLLVNRLLEQRKKLADPGVISGLLFGLVEDGLAIVQALREFAPELAAAGFGTRTEQDKLLEQHLAAAQKAPDTASLTLIGWYGIRATGGLAQSDVTYHGWYFPRPHDLALIVKPEGAADITLELYCRTLTGQLTEDSFRVGLVRLSTAPLESPVEIVPRPKIQDDFFMRAYELEEADEEKGRGWQGSFAVTYRKAFGFLRPKDEEKKDRAVEAKPPERIIPDPVPPAPNPAAAVVPQVPAPPPVPQAPQPSVPAALETRPAPAPVASVPAPPPAPEPPPSVPTLRRVPLPAESNRKSIWPTVLAAFVAASVATFGIVFYLRATDHLPAILQVFTKKNGLQLKVEAQGERLLLSWDRQNALVQQARDGDLLIEDGAQSRRVTLTASQISNGSILYRPKTDEVTFRLQVHSTDGQQIEESMKVLDSAKPAVLDLTPDSGVPSVPQVGNSGAPGSLGEVFPKQVRPAAKPVNPATRITDSNKAEGSEPENAVKPDSTSTEPVISKNSVPKSKPDADKEEVLATPEEQSNNRPQQKAPLIGEAGNAPNPLTPMQSQPALPGPAKGVEKAAPSRSVGESLATYEPPRPTRQVLPPVSSLPPGVLAQTSQLEVLVKLDELGRVTDAQAVTNGKKYNQLLVASALAAARQWRFKPALMRGRPVVSQHSIVFQFVGRP